MVFGGGYVVQAFADFGAMWIIGSAWTTRASGATSQTASIAAMAARDELAFQAHQPRPTQNGLK